MNRLVTRFDRRVIGAVLGGVAGLVLTKRALGAVALAAAGYVVAARWPRSRPDPETPRAPSPSLRFLEDQIALAAALARVGGDFDAAARHAARSWFEVDLRCDAANLARVDRAIDRAVRQPSTGTETVARALVAAHSPTRLERERVLFSLFRVALAAPSSAARDAALRGAAIGLGLTADDVESQRTAFVPSLRGRATPADYDLLGARPGMAPERLKECYREAARTWHPDRFTHLGPQKAAHAAERFKAIQRAWDLVAADSERAGPPRAARCPNCRTFTAIDETECIRCGHAKIETLRGAKIIRCAYCRFETPLLAARMANVVDCKNCRAVVIQ